MPKLIIDYNKTLKLTNVIIVELAFEAIDNLAIALEHMENYIRSKGFQPVGPHIQHMNLMETNTNEIDVVIKLIRQTTGFIHPIEKPYKSKPIIRVSNCLYTRYRGSKENMKFAYDKLNLTAYEEDIPLKGDNYSVFLDEADDQVAVDIFMERTG